MFVAIDLETTGLDAQKDKIIEVAITKFDPKTFEIVDSFSSLVNPEIPIPNLNSSITGIYDSDVKDAPKWKEILQKVSDYIGEAPIVGHNVYFDTGFLESKGITLDDNPILDTFLISNFLVLGEKSLSLEYLCKYFEIPFTGAHRALNDVLATIELFKKLLNRLETLPQYKKEIISYVLLKSDDEGMKFLNDTFLDLKNTIENDEEFVKKLEEIIPESKKYEKIITDTKLEDFDFSELIGGKVGLEKRENQEKMAKTVYSTIAKQNLSAIEAPTGIGKTYAYILPSIFHSIKTGEQVFVSTSTKALQDQIFYTDLKSLQEECSLKFSYSKLKGKRNYIGIGSFSGFLSENQSYSLHKTSFVLKMLLWLSVTSHGELDELEYYGQEFSFLYEVNADDSQTFSNDNVYLDKEFAVIARRQAKKTNIVVINNNILFQDLDGDGSILSKVENLVVDEAHNLEEVLTQSLQKSFCIDDLENAFLRVEKKLLIEKEKVPGISIKKEKTLFELSLIVDILNSYLSRKVSSSSKYKIHLINKDFYLNEGQDILKNSLSQKLQMLFIDYLDSLQGLDDKVYNKLSREISYIENSLDIVGKCLSNTSAEKYICFLNYRENKGLYLEYTFLNPGDYLEKNLWKKLSSCVLTSATLKSGEDFSYIKKMLHLQNFDFFELDTDFDYKNQALLYVPDDIGSIKNNMNTVVQFMLEFMLRVKGRTLFLCTSFYTIKELFSGIDMPLKKEGIHVYAQSIGGGKKKLIDFYKDNAEKSILIGTNTFWEGVDIPGEKLKYLIIHKIPFMVPTDPIFQARGALFSDPFSEYAVPKAILKLKQGFGRLIRTKDDSGVIVFLDDRIYSTTWGSQLYNAFPEDIRKKIGRSTDLLQVLKDIE